MKSLCVVRPLLVLAIFISLVFSSCTNCIELEGEIETKSLALDDFKKLKVSIPADVKIEIGNYSEISITAPSSLFKTLETPVSGRTLEIETRDCINSSGKEINIVLKVEELSEIVVDGSADIEVVDEMVVDDLRIKANGSGSIQLIAITDRIDAEINGSGSLGIGGKVDRLNVKTNGSGGFNGFDLLANESSVKINGSGYTNIQVLEKLKVKINGSGNVSYKGDPELRSETNGSGKLTKVD